MGLIRAPTFEGPSMVRDKPPSEIVTPAAARQRFLQRNEQGGLPYRFVLCSNWRLRTLRDEQPELFVLSEFHWRERARTNHDQAEHFLRALAEDYDLIAEFSNFPPEHRLIFLQTFAPHDWLYPFPVISVYRRR